MYGNFALYSAGRQGYLGDSSQLGAGGGHAGPVSLQAEGGGVVWGGTGSVLQFD